MTTRFVFGDIHGHYDTLILLLDKIGIDTDSIPDDVELIFLGDLIDRGPKSYDVVRLVKKLCDSGKARCILANHEFNFVNFNTKSKLGTGSYRRPRSDKNLTEIAETWASYRVYGRHDNETLEEHVKWMESLPIALELDDINLVHACWHEESLSQLQKRGDGYYLSDELWERASDKDDPIYKSVEILCKGLEKELPDGMSFLDRNGVTRTLARVCWWKRNPSDWNDYVLGADLSALEGLPPDNLEFSVSKPTLFGHYWRTGLPQIEDKMASCLDFSVAAYSGGYLCAYEFRCGDKELFNERLHYIRRDGH